jgi:glycosyltransferase involved in cell wall biosynthesis
MIQRVAVIVPAADEQDRIAACLAAIEEARCRLLQTTPTIEGVDVIVVLDACSDETPAIVGRFAAVGHVRAITSGARLVGAARRLGAQQALQCGVPADRLWLANTDADSTVPANWLTGMVAAADGGAQVVLGTVLPGAGLTATLRAAWLAPHHLREGHPHVHGANLGIRADTYLELGGWDGGLASAEDVDLAGRAAAAPDVRILRTAAIPVLTSVRMAGRAPGGFSSYIRHLREQHPVTRSPAARLQRSRGPARA